MTTDAQQVAAWNALLVSARKWGRPVRFQELEAAVQLIERLMATPVLTNAGFDVARFGEVVTGLGANATPANIDRAWVREAQANQAATHAFAPTQRAGSLDLKATKTLAVDSATLGPHPSPNPPTDPQTLPTVAPRTDGKREDRARAFNEWARPLRAQGMGAKEIGQRWQEQKAKETAP